MWAASSSARNTGRTTSRSSWVFGGTRWNSGPAGVWQFVQMAMSLNQGEFTHFWDVVSDALTFQGRVPLGPEPEYTTTDFPSRPSL